MMRAVRYILLLLPLLIAGCSTTKRIADDDALYDGMKLKIEGEHGEKMPGGLKS